MDSLQDEVKAALRSTDRLKLRASSDRCGISTTSKTSTAQLRRNLQQWLEDVDGLVLPPRCSAVILRRAFTTVLCSSVALVCARRDYAVISVGTLSTSIAYWRKPRRGSVERQFDRLWVLLSFLYQGRSACRELGVGRLAAYWTLALVTLCCYARARRLGAAGSLDASARWHSGIHLVGNVANAILYADPGLGAAAGTSRAVEPEESRPTRMLRAPMLQGEDPGEVAVQKVLLSGLLQLPEYLLQGKQIERRVEEEELAAKEAAEVRKSLQASAAGKDGAVIEEWNYLDNFFKRYNKVLLDVMAIERERDRLGGENSDLRSILKQYLDGISVNPDVINNPNPLLVVNHKTNIVMPSALPPAPTLSLPPPERRTGAPAASERAGHPSRPRSRTLVAAAAVWLAWPPSPPGKAFPWAARRCGPCSCPPWREASTPEPRPSGVTWRWAGCGRPTSSRFSSS